ncbi:MAG: protein translocase subunit SecF [Nitrospinaceae bacterium]|jgi:preprotein translocase subunit SecF
MELIKKQTHIDFMGKFKTALMLSGLLILAGFVSIAVHGGLKFGIDFEGGTLVQLKFPEAPAIDSIRSGLREIGLADSTIQEFGSPDTILIRVEIADGELKEMGTRIKKALEETKGFTGIIIERVEMVGPKVGKDLRIKALLSILYAIIGIVIYISWRFEFQYAIAAIIALIHDVLITMGAFSVLDKEFTLVIVAAFLTIIGYSLNDTIVVFDRIRENTRRRSKELLSDVINTSINQTLSRTLLTSGTTLLVVVALFVLGGEIIHDFSFALLVGVVVGTYSSIFIASVFLLYWESRAHPKRA